MKIAFSLALLLVSFSVVSQEKAYVTIQGNSNLTIDKNIYGHFSEHLGRCIYDGFWTGDHIRMDIVNALKKINIPVLRWPGGCFADQYHWKDAIGPREQRKKTVNTTWGMGTEDNRFGTHEFFEVC